ncbi:unnamed protein product [Angiostrongylus costaricensis]|uniref:ABC2_membrane_7 domain-containing protein n=1 Tax=Angiostrongylus costaricensis TaxID=334426 RepID=A0A0R3PC73_ANGCS|nr:unnamed protein product [Angiostrongylus costaricensis]
MTTLAIGYLRHVVCSRLTTAEAFRLNIAEQLLKDSEIILCDDIAKQMDVYEVAFVVDFLRDWAIKLNRVVIMAITPSSFDMLLMFSKCALLTAGRIVYFESATKITQYFESIGFPCPKFKNPCEFYGKLCVTMKFCLMGTRERKVGLALLRKICVIGKAMSCSPDVVTGTTAFLSFPLSSKISPLIQISKSVFLNFQFSINFQIFL